MKYNKYYAHNFVNERNKTATKRHENLSAAACI